MKFDLNNKTNRFAQRTLAAFSGALMELLESKPFEKITVNEICDACNYPRATFYNYFDDSYDLLNYCWTAMSREVKIADYPDMQPEERLYIIFDRIYDYFDAYRERLKRIRAVNPQDGALVISCMLFIRQQAVDIMLHTPCTQRYEIPFRLVAEHYCNTMQLVIEWSFMRGEIQSKQEAERCLRYLLQDGQEGKQ